MARLADVARETWNRYESDALTPGSPALVALARAGADVTFVLTGERAGEAVAMPSRALSRREQALVDNHVHADEEGKRTIERVADLAAQSRIARTGS